MSAITFRVSEMTVGWLIHSRDLITLDPPYQRRGGVWRKIDRAYLIDSILNGFDLPKFYFADRRRAPALWVETGLPLAVVDGVQRITSILAFYDGELRLPIGTSLFEFPARDLSGATFPMLRSEHPDLAERFLSFRLTCVMLETQSEDLVREVFVRLNRGTPLTAAEIGRAGHGRTPRAVQFIVSDPFFVEYLRVRASRGQDLDAATRLLLAEVVGHPVSLDRQSLSKYLLWQPDDVVEGAAARVLETLVLLRRVFYPRDPLLSAFGRIPTYYSFVARHYSDNPIRLRGFLAWVEDIVHHLDWHPPASDHAVALVRTIVRARRTPNEPSSVERSVDALERLYQGEDWTYIG